MSRRDHTFSNAGDDPGIRSLSFWTHRSGAGANPASGLLHELRRDRTKAAWRRAGIIAETVGSGARQPAGSAGLVTGRRGPRNGAKISGALWMFWDIYGYHFEGRAWLDQNTAQIPGVDD